MDIRLIDITETYPAPIPQPDRPRKKPIPDPNYRPKNKTLAAYKQLPDQFYTGDWAAVADCSTQAAFCACKYLTVHGWLKKEFVKGKVQHLYTKLVELK